MTAISTPALSHLRALEAEAIHVIREVAADAMRLGPGQRVLDGGCGLGEAAYLLALRVGPEGSVDGVDKSQNMLALADRLKSHLIASLESLGHPERGVGYVRERLAELGVVETDSDGGLEAVLEGLSEREVRQIVQALLAEL